MRSISNVIDKAWLDLSDLRRVTNYNVKSVLFKVHWIHCDQPICAPFWLLKMCYIIQFVLHNCTKSVINNQSIVNSVITYIFGTNCKFLPTKVVEIRKLILKWKLRGAHRTATEGCKRGKKIVLQDFLEV